MTTSYTITCIERAVEHIMTSLDAERVPSLENIAAASGLSKFHFNRLYRLVTGETTRDTVTRLRLARAANMLKDPKVTVTDAAFTAGYSSSQAFAKALRRVLDASASEIRESEDRLTSAIETLVTPINDDGVLEPALKVRVASLEPFDVISMRTDGAYPALNAHYWTLFEAAGGEENVLAILGAPHGDIDPSQNQDLRFDCALKLAHQRHDLPDNIQRDVVRGGIYLMTRHTGPYAGLTDAVDRLYLTVLSDPEIEIADDRMVFHYIDDPDNHAPEVLRTDLYLPLNINNPESL